MTGIELIAAERERQQTVEGWTPEHDDEHETGEMLGAATSYLQEGYAQIFEDAAPPSVNGHGEWPWDMKWWKPSPDPVRNLVKAGALIAAEIDRLQRAKERDDVPTDAQ